MEDAEQKWRTVRETAMLLQVPLTRCYELIHAGEIPAVRIGQRSIRVPGRELEQILLEQRKVVQR